jgi:hypothetical protein
MSSVRQLTHLEKAREALQIKRLKQKKALEEYELMKKNNRCITEETEEDDYEASLATDTEDIKILSIKKYEDEIKELKSLVKHYEDDIKNKNIKVYEKFINSKITNYDEILSNRLKLKKNKDRDRYDVIKDIYKMCKDLDDD